ncbi:MAG: hypothetical protein SOU49_11100 [Sodaliphilus pleomorphus]|uniref:hypothetical protein n=1 Tax=Sodaliphilus pleomorphus TaxID=2606626 RepID=UPI0023EF5707|nr:hypothetical protein [Sodaliphilus pleomorphus]MDD7065239.1 hypothetical protein [Sodaliphilus pleomorphus]MDY2833269.1 hypothetical protein [Sodaliphilus pleomorphus]
MKKFTIIASLVLMMVVGTSSAQAVTSKPRSQAPARAEATNSNMKILTLAEAQAITFTWTDAQGVEHANSIADPATDPRHIVALLREIYINRKVPGIKKVGYSSADVTTPDSGPVTYIITDDYLIIKTGQLGNGVILPQKGIMRTTKSVQFIIFLSLNKPIGTITQQDTTSMTTCPKMRATPRSW